jgi:hypothetical protein
MKSSNLNNNRHIIIQYHDQVRSGMFPVFGLENDDDVGGLYRPFLQYAWEKLHESGILLPSDNDSGTIGRLQETSNLVPSDLSRNVANDAKGMPPGTQIRISIDAAKGKSSSPITYVRYALLETIPPPRYDETVGNNVFTSGIQVLNFVMFTKPPLPVWGVDLVSLPGGRHLLTIDAQPMTIQQQSSTKDPWKDWYESYVQNSFLPWGGDLPKDAQKFFSPHALWTRLTNDNELDEEGRVHMIRTHIFDAFCAHLDIFLKTSIATEDQVKKEENDNENVATQNHHLEEYLDYRLANDPARPMLKSLYGTDWTERVLHEILFNKERVLRG